VEALINISTPMGQSLRRRDKYQNPKSKHRRTLPRQSLLTHDIDPEVLIQIIQQRRLPSYMTLWIKAFTANRKLAFGFDGKSEDRGSLIELFHKALQYLRFFSLSQLVRFLRTRNVILRLLRNKTNSIHHMSMILV
jgi:hypothetical protein